jgi:uncharacterized zinc-type alcohol dehydrogenase-like protein
VEEKMKVKGYAATKPGDELKPFEYELGALGDSQVDIDVEYCGICYSDLSMLDNEWGMTQYPFVPGHEIVGTVSAAGARVKDVTVGQRVGLGWYAGSCMTCEWCMSGDHNLCPSAEATIIGRYGGFADKVRSEAAWVVPLPEQINAEAAGPLFCGGITVFNPIVQLNIKPTDRVGVVGIGGLGHMALKFLDAWGCEVTAFSTSPEKETEAKAFGADHFVNSRDPKALEAVAGSFDLILSTVNASLDWNAYIAALRPKGRLHIVGAVLKPLSVDVFPLIVSQKYISASPLGSPVTTAKMLEFAARHKIEPTVETFRFDQVNDAMEKLRNGKPRYRIVLKH